MLKLSIPAYLFSLSHPFPAEVVGTGDQGPGEMIADNEENQTISSGFLQTVSTSDTCIFM